MELRLRLGKRLNDFGRQRDDFHEFLVAQFASDRAEDTGATGIHFLVNDNNGIAVETKVRTVVAPDRLARSHHHRIHDLAFLDGAIGRGLLDVRFDDVANAGVTLISAEHTDGRRAFGAGVVSDVKYRTNL